MTWDCKAARVTGAYRFGKVRVLWRDGELRCFNAVGQVLATTSAKPVRAKGRIRVWLAETENGQVTIAERCWTCGGWWRIASQSAEALWDGAPASTGTPV